VGSRDLLAGITVAAGAALARSRVEAGMTDDLVGRHVGVEDGDLTEEQRCRALADPGRGDRGLHGPLQVRVGVGGLTSLDPDPACSGCDGLALVIEVLDDEGGGGRGAMTQESANRLRTSMTTT